MSRRTLHLRRVLCDEIHALVGRAQMAAEERLGDEALVASRRVTRVRELAGVDAHVDLEAASGERRKIGRATKKSTF